MTMTKDDLIKAIAEKTSRPKLEIGLVLDGLRSAAAEALQQGDAVTIPDMVKLAPKDRAARTGRNPATGAVVAIPAKTVVSAKVVPALAKVLA